MIKEFKNEFRWLSNFFPCRIVLKGREYKSVEHAYMSAKCDDEDWKLFCQFTEKPGEVKKSSRKIKLREDWESIKINIMKDCIDQKFNQEPLKTKLLETGEEELQEGNTWGDKFWGIDLKTGKGLNYLGKIIMCKRHELQRKQYNEKNL